MMALARLPIGKPPDMARPFRPAGSLSPQQQRILDVLKAAYPDWMKSAQILEAIGSSGSPKTLHVQIFNIRRALGDAVCIEAERIGPTKRGYRLVCWAADREAA